MSHLPVTPRTELRRHPERGSRDLALIHAILDEALLCHVSFVHEAHPVVLPMAYVRVQDYLYLHGATNNRMLETLAAGAPACIAVTLLDGLVFARSQFSHSMNYRSVVLFGQAERVLDPERQRHVLAALCDKLAPGRSGESRPPSRQELAATLVLGVPVREASAKQRGGPPQDRAGDLALPHWAGVVPLEVRRGAPLADPNLSPGVGLSAAVQSLYG